jgi:hypothetical protein
VVVHPTQRVPICSDRLDHRNVVQRELAVVLSGQRGFDVVVLRDGCEALQQE